MQWPEHSRKGWPAASTTALLDALVNLVAQGHPTVATPINFCCQESSRPPGYTQRVHLYSNAKTLCVGLFLNG